VGVERRIPSVEKRAQNRPRAWTSYMSPLAPVGLQYGSHSLKQAVDSHNQRDTAAPPGSWTSLMWFTMFGLLKLAGKAAVSSATQTPSSVNRAIWHIS
jgi:hypothetical protein